jgi:peptidoglycan/LPS O-acetylase OafA/YrhL
MTFDILGLFPGVPLFFLTSGFLITDSYLNSNSLKSYAIKRGLRIYPALFINILILEFAMYIGGNMKNFDLSFMQYIEYLFTYISSASSGSATTLLGINGSDIYNMDGFFSAYPSGVLWTLTIEITFYIALPFMFILHKKNKLFTVALLIGIAFLSIYISGLASKEFYRLSSIHQLLEITFLPFAWMFIIGVMSRLYWNTIKVYLVNKGLYLLLIYILFSYLTNKYLGSGLWVGYKYNLNFVTVVEVLLLSIAMLSMAFSFTNLKVNLKSDLSYSTYLYHMLVVHIILSSGMTTNGYTYFIIIGITLCIAYLSWNYIEKPMLRFKPKAVK